MTATADYCEMCDLPKSQCIHGLPPPAVEKPVKAPPKAKPRKRAAPRTTRSTATPQKTATPRWTPPETLKPLIIAVLQRAGGELEAEQLFGQLEVLAEGQLLPADSEKTPGGEPRWQYAARRARVALIEEGVMSRTTPGVWQLA